MPRPVSRRQVENVPQVTWFKPAGAPMRDLEEVVLTVDEVEALRLADMEGMYQDAVAEGMGVSRPTVGRILASARKKVATALVLGQAIRVEGGNVEVIDRKHGCNKQKNGHGHKRKGGCGHKRRCGRGNDMASDNLSAPAEEKENE